MGFKDNFSPKVVGAANKTRAALTRMRTGAQRMGMAFKNAVFSVKGLVAALAGLVIIRQVVRWIAESVELAQQQEAAIVTLNASLRAAGNYSEEASLSLQKFATELQHTIGIGDETTLAMMGIIEGLTKLSTKALPDAMRATVGLATMLNMDMKTAAITVGKTLTSSTNALVRYAIEIDMTADAQGRLNQLLEATAAGMKIAEEKAMTYEGRMMMLTAAWGDMKEAVGRWITQSPGVLKVLEVLTGWIGKMTTSIDDANESSTDLVGVGFANIISGGISLSRGIIAIGRGFTQLGLWALQAGAALYKLWIAIMDMPTAMLAVINPQLAIARGFGLVDRSASSTRASLGVLQEKILEYDQALWSSFDTTDILVQAQQDLAAAMLTVEGAASVANSGAIVLTNQLDDLSTSAGGVEDAVDGVTSSINEMADAIERAIPKPQPLDKLIELLEALENVTTKEPSAIAGMIAGRYTGMGAMDAGFEPVGKPDVPDLPLSKLGFDLRKRGKGPKGAGAIPTWQTNDFLMNLAGAGIGGFAGDGAQGAITSMLPMIGGAVFGAPGAAIGALLGGLFGKKQKPRGNDPSKPVFVSDVNTANLMTELLNITKAQLGRSGAGGVNAINAMIRAQAGTSGAV